MTEEDEILQILEKIGAHEVTEKEKKEPGYRKLVEEVNSPERRVQTQRTIAVRDSLTPYSAKRKRPSK